MPPNPSHLKPSFPNRIIANKDIEDIKFVINVDYPQATEDYVHRIGRTARNSNSGTSYTFITRNNARHVPELVNVLRETNQEISDELLNLAGGRGGYNRNGGGLLVYNN